jgi:hypothetical protein
VNHSRYITKKETPGTSKKDISEELRVINCSFFNNFTPSIIACKIPIKLTLVGPRRFCLLPRQCRSKRVIKAILCIIQIMINKIITKINNNKKQTPVDLQSKILFKLVSLKVNLLINSQKF